MTMDPPQTYGRKNPELASMQPEKLLEIATNSQCRAVTLLIKAFIDTLGEEQAGKVIYKARWDAFYQKGREIAEKMGLRRV